MTHPSDDIFESLFLVRDAFMRAGLEPPAAIVLKTHEDGMRFLSAVGRTGFMRYSAPDPAYKPVEHPDGSIWMEATFADMKIHWPANRYAKMAGGYVFG